MPFFVSGAAVSRIGEDSNLLCSTDLYSTIAEIAGAGSGQIHDSKSFVPLLSSEGEHRNFQYSEMNNGTDDIWAISNGDYKLIVNANGEEELYYLDIDPYESDNLLEETLSDPAAAAKLQLESELLEIRN